MTPVQPRRIRLRLRWHRDGYPVTTRWLHWDGAAFEWHDTQATTFEAKEAEVMARRVGGEVVGI